jgi:predicted nucleotide-binding protein
MPKIVLIDDDFATELIVERLADRGYEARRINSADAALATISEIVSADLVILDVIMARPPSASPVKITGDMETGMEILRKVRESKPTLPVIVFSATADRDLIEMVSQMSNTEFLSKWGTPSLGDLIQHVDRRLGRSQVNAATKCFIVHGHDDVEKLSLKNYLQNTLKLPEPLILHELPNLGRTIIEKFEDAASETDLVFVLLTPDDQLAPDSSSNNEKRRARQNVIFELGYFLGVLGRRSGQVLLLHKGNLDLPSDISGVIYVDISSGVAAAGEQIRREISHVLC